MAKSNLLKIISTFLDSDLAKIGVALAAILVFLISLFKGYDQLADRFKEPTATPRIVRSHIHTSTVESPKYDLPPIKCIGDCSDYQKYRAIPVRIRLINPRAEAVSFMNFQLFLSNDPILESEEIDGKCGFSTLNRFCFGTYKVDDERINPTGEFNTPVTLLGHQTSDVNVIFAAWLMVLESKNFRKFIESDASDLKISNAKGETKDFFDIKRIGAFPYYYLRWEDQNGVNHRSVLIDDEWDFKLRKVFENNSKNDGEK